MTRVSLLSSFTLDNEIKEWVPGDDTIELHGYVDSIEGLKSVESNKKPVNLYKIIVNNGSTYRVRVLFWGELATKWSALIQDRTVISIVRGRTAVPKMRFNNPNDSVHSLKLYILQSTAITLNDTKFEDEVDNKPIPEVSLSNILDTSGQCYIEGYVKQTFIKVTAYNGCFGRGVLVKDDYKLSVKIAHYEERKTFKKGSCVRALGKIVVRSQAAPEFLVRSVDDITTVDSTAELTEPQLRVIGFRTPKRKSEGLHDSTATKKNPFDS